MIIAGNRKYDQSGAYRGDNHYSKDTNDYYKVSFNGIQIRLYEAQ